MTRPLQHKWYLSAQQLEETILAMDAWNKANPNRDYVKRFGRAYVRKLQDMRAEALTKNKLSVRLTNEAILELEE